MRLLVTYPNKHNAQALSSFLENEGIQNLLEAQVNREWDNQQYGEEQYSLWIYDEDDLAKAQDWRHEFEQNPESAKFHAFEKKFDFPEVNPTVDKAKSPKKETPKAAPLFQRSSPLSGVTFLVILICTLIFILCEITTPPPLETLPTNVPATPLITSQTKKELLFDYPAAFETIDKISLLYGRDKVLHPEELPPEGKFLFQKYLNTPYWKGFYQKIVNKIRNPENMLTPTAPLFEKIRQGEIWRLLSPTFLHSDIFHLLFNMIWLLVLGKQIEENVGKARLILFIVLTGIISNVAQYLMSGASFLGFSGVIVGMLTFVWCRQRLAAWEGYQMQQITFALMAFFIFAMFALQFASFIVEVYTQTPLSIGIANTAHLTGGVCGLVMGRMEFFASLSK